MSIGVALVGSGIFAREEHLPAIIACKDLSLKAIYSRSAKSAKSLLESTDEIPVYSDDSGSGKTFHDLLLREDVHAVIIALPIVSQPEYIEAALLAGKHVLSEKPIAKDLKHAEQLLHFYNTKIKNDAKLKAVTWAVAENFRFHESILFAAKEVKRLGKVLGFRVTLGANVLPGTKYFETSWRKVPEYQGGFLLDGGVHFVAAMRLLLGDEAKPAAVSAFTTLLKPHLPPVDTVNSIWALESKVSGTFSASFGTTFKGLDFTVACEKGTVAAGRLPGNIMKGSKVVVSIDGKDAETTFENDGSGVEPEVKAWAQSIMAGKPHPLQAPEQALADLEILQKMLESGESHGKTEVLSLQI